MKEVAIGYSRSKLFRNIIWLLVASGFFALLVIFMALYTDMDLDEYFVVALVPILLYLSLFYIRCLYKKIPPLVLTEEGIVDRTPFIRSFMTIPWSMIVDMRIYGDNIVYVKVERLEDLLRYNKIQKKPWWGVFR